MADLVKAGNVLLHPTDTVWGLAAIMSDRDAVNKIYEIKHRPRSKPLLLLVDNIERLKKYVLKLHPRIETLLSYHVRPLTIIYDKSRDIPDYLTAEDGSIAIRIVRDLACQKLIKDIDAPIVSTSANLAGDGTPSSFDSISPRILNAVDILFRPDISIHKSNGQSSVIVRLDRDTEELIFLRE